jgi:hypothetical protein
MILDLLSPSNVTELILKDSNAMIGFLGFIFIAGTILGVIIDGFHHRIIEMRYFSYIDMIAEKNKDMNHITISEIEKHLQKQMRCDNCSYCGDCKFTKEGSYGLTKIYYAFNLENMDKCVALHDYLRRTVYHYYEFYANTFIAMIPFSLVTPIYMVKIFNIDYYYFALGAGIALAFLTIACLDFAWMAYDRWISDLYFAFCRCLGGRTLEWNKYRETFYDFPF